MPLHLQIVFYTGKNILMLYIIIVALNIYFKPKEENRYDLLTYGIYIVLGIVSHFITTTAWMNVFLNIFLVYMLLINFRGSIKRKIIMSCAWSMFTMISEMVIVMVVVGQLGITINEVLLSESISFILILSHVLVFLIIVKAGALYKKKNQCTEKFIIFNSLYVCIIPLCSVCILHFFAIIALVYPISHHIIIVVCTIIILMNVFFFILFDKLRLAEKMKYEYVLLQNEAEYFLRLEENVNDTFKKVRTIKHNLKYHLLFLKSKTEEKSLESLDEIRRTLDTLIEETLSDNHIEYTKNKSINRLLNFKLLSLSERGIEVDIKVAINEDAYIDEVSLYTIIGNVLDNAIRNFDSSNAEMKHIIVRLIADGDNLFIKVANPYNKKLNFKNGLPVTDKEDREIHGIGLQSVKDLVESKDGYIKITNNDNIFNLEIILYEEIKVSVNLTTPTNSISCEIY